ncbi:MAG TPA: sulfate adenylyltransferase, partial [Gammaproteobacteria bacterium]|nr:sulfate adenylyltransferase [Gammaproteobacteria bacterium]
MIKPYQSDQLQPRYVDDEAKRARLQVEIRKYAALTISSGAAANAVMLGAGYFTPLT